MNAVEVLLSAALGLAINESSDLSPGLARLLVRWSTYRRYSDADRAEQRAEELAAYINDRPGKLFKLIVALGFTIQALARGRTPSGVPNIAVASHTPGRQTLDLDFPPYRGEAEWPQRAQLLRAELDLLDQDIAAALKACGKRCMTLDAAYRATRLAKITGAPGWNIVADNIAQLRDAVHSIERMPDEGAGPYITTGRMTLRPVRYYTPTRAQVAEFRDAARRIRHDIRELLVPPGDHPGPSTL